MKKIQTLNHHKWKWFKFIKGNPLKIPSAFHLAYKWSFFVGIWEIRKLRTKIEMKQALEIYSKKKAITNK